jgi:hypothetical protein
MPAPKIVSLNQRKTADKTPVTRSDAERHREHVGFVRGIAVGAIAGIALIWVGGMLNERSFGLGIMMGTSAAKQAAIDERIERFGR